MLRKYLNLHITHTEERTSIEKLSKPAEGITRRADTAHNEWSIRAELALHDVAHGGHAGPSTPELEGHRLAQGGTTP
jgi:hypothetical protein